MNPENQIQSTASPDFNFQQWLQTPISQMTIMSRPVPGLLLGVITILMGIAGTCYFTSESIRSFQCSEFTTGRLALDCQETSTSRKGRVVDTEYKVRYSFSVDGQQYSGTDTVRSKPSSLDTRVQYNPKNPHQNQLRSHHNFLEILITIGLCIGGSYLAFFANFTANSK